MKHLNDEQINDALIGDLEPAAAQHLDSCLACQQQLTDVRMPLENFKAVTLAWSERRSATMPVSVSERAILHAAGVRRRVWGSAMAALLAMMVAVPYGLRRENNQNGRIASIETSEVQRSLVVGATGVVSGQTQHSEINAEQIDRDNQMLNEIDRELDSNTASTAAIELQDVQAQASRPAAGRAVQD